MKKSFPPLQGPMLDTATLMQPSNAACAEYPFCVDLIKNFTTLAFPTQVTFLVGENGTGKSTLLESLALKAGFGSEGGSRNMNFRTCADKHATAGQRLADCLTLSWRFKPRDGYFFRAESFFNVANHLDYLAAYDGAAYLSYGGKSLHEQSHGESFLAFFANRLGSNGFFILDEPEAALSPQRQLSLLAIMHRLCTQSAAQFIIATHSPILLAYPGATIYSCDGGSLREIAYTQTEHYRLTKTFLDNPELYLRHLFEEE